MLTEAAIMVLWHKQASGGCKDWYFENRPLEKSRKRSSDPSLCSPCSLRRWTRQSGIPEQVPRKRHTRTSAPRNCRCWPPKWDHFQCFTKPLRRSRRSRWKHLEKSPEIRSGRGCGCDSGGFGWSPAAGVASGFLGSVCARLVLLNLLHM